MSFRVVLATIMMLIGPGALFALILL